MSDKEQPHIMKPRRWATTKGPMIACTAKRIAKTAFETARDEVRHEIWQTEGGALIAFIRANPLDESRGRNVSAYIAEPKDYASEQQMQIDVLQWLGWDGRMVTLVRETLEWDLIRRVE